MSYKLLIVEDEKVERESTLLTIQLYLSDVFTVEAAENGIEALQKFQQEIPDVVIMDIDLPGFSGIETIAKMQELSGHTQYVILTAYKMFDYAQAALKLGVLEYLLKPCNVTDLVGAVNAARQRIEAGKNSTQVNQEIEKRLTEIRPVLESDCIYAIAAMRGAAPLCELFQILQMQPGVGFVFAIKSDAAQRKLLAVVKKGLQRIDVGCIGEAINGLCIFAVLGGSARTQGKLQFFAGYLANLLDEAQLACTIGVGLESTSVEQLSVSYHQAMKALTHATVTGKPYEIYVEGIAQAKQEEIPVKETASELIRLVKAQDHNAIEQTMEALFARWALEDCPRSQVDNAVYRIWLVIVGGLPEVLTDELLEDVTLHKIRCYPDLSSLCRKMTQVLTQISILTLSEESWLAHSSDLTVRAVSIIHERYAQHISLNQVAQELNITPFYLSKLVKKQVGKTFTDYLIQYRIERAKELLLQNKRSVKEITYEVGFNSQNYFAKIFKKYTQYSPSDYRSARHNLETNHASFRSDASD